MVKNRGKGARKKAALKAKQRKVFLRKTGQLKKNRNGRLTMGSNSGR